MNRPNHLILRILITGAAAAIAVGGLLALGQYLRDDLHSSDRYQLSIHDIDCESPPGRSRSDFLSEVHYYGQLPEKLNVLDADFTDTLRKAFAKHPQVKSVEKVTVTAPKNVHVELLFREKERS